MSFGTETFDASKHEACEACQGEGGWWIRTGNLTFLDMQEQWEPEETFEPCRECSGKGYVPKGGLN